MKTNIIKGNSLMLFDSAGKSYAYATNHTLTLTAETSDVSSKDHGMWSGAEVSKYTWEIQTENLYTVTDYDAMFSKLIAGEPVDVKFGVKAENDPTKTVVDGDYTNWSAGTGYYSGKAIITSLTANAQNGDNATYSCTFTGVGKLVKGDLTSA